MTTLRLTFLVVVMFLGWSISVTLAAGPNYQYGEAWWEEYAPDAGTAILLHFGPAQSRPWTTVAGMAPAVPPGSALATAISPTGQVLDYAHNATFALPIGANIVANGRFGAGLHLEKSPGLVVKAEYGQGQGLSMECFFRIDRYPAKPVCLLSMNKDEARLMLQRDGTLEVVRKKQHGTPSSGLTDEQLTLTMTMDATVRSKVPIPLKQWTHVMVHEHRPVVSGPQPMAVTLLINGVQAARFVSEPGNDYSFMGRFKDAGKLLIGNNDTGTEPFTGDIDEVRVSYDVERLIYPRIVPAFDTKQPPSSPLPLGRPYFRSDDWSYYLSFDKGTAYDRKGPSCEGTGLVLPEKSILTAMTAPGVRGQGLVIDPGKGFPQLDIRGMSAREGTLECWLRPVNWDDWTGYWQHTPPENMRVSILRFYGRDKIDNKVKLFMEVRVDRATNLERQRAGFDPGQWSHLLLIWTGQDQTHATLYRNGNQQVGTAWRADPKLQESIDPLYVEFGVSDPVVAAYGERPVTMVDEVVGYKYAFSDTEERTQAYQRCLKKLSPIKLYSATFDYKFSIGKLTLEVTPKLPVEVIAKTVTAWLRTAKGAIVAGPVTAALDGKPGQTAKLLLRNHQPVPYGDYWLTFQIADTAGKVVVKDKVAWNFPVEPWRDNKCGILQTPPTPWTPIVVKDLQFQTRMITYMLGKDGLPTEIIAAGKNLLQGPMQLLEAGKPMTGTPLALKLSSATEAVWTATFTGASCAVTLNCRLEYDGMLRFELRVQPKTPTVESLSLLVPMQAKYATHFLFNEAGRPGMGDGLVPTVDGVFLGSRHPAFWRTQAEARKNKRRDPVWEQYQGWGFMNQFDLNDTERGLFWFADNATGWEQSKSVEAQECSRLGDTINVRLNLIAEPVAYQTGKPIVFGMLPHPARPLPDKYRIFDRVTPQVDPVACSVFDAFRAWPRDPRSGGSYGIFPKDPVKGADDIAASWAWAESCLPSMKVTKTAGLRTMYLSNFWIGARAGMYDNWEWRAIPGSRVMHSPRFVDYLAWEMDGWVKRDIWQSIYLDECYESFSENTEAGQAVILPDGSIQPGLTIFGFREMMKRWRSIFVQYGKEPLISVHHTRCFLYPGIIFADIFLDGEGFPEMRAGQPDFVAQMSLSRIEQLQNGPLWGLAPYYMPSVWEIGWWDKGNNPHKRWAWRMARSAVSTLAHFENGYTYYDQGGSVYVNYWEDVLRWGAGDPKTVPFVPYYRGDAAVQALTPDTLVSSYRKPNSMLLIASNRKVEVAEVQIKLDLATLGLGAHPKVENWDTGHTPVAGDDFANAPVGLPDGQDVAPRAWIEGDVLHLPARGHDFRMVSITAGE